MTPCPPSLPVAASTAVALPPRLSVACRASAAAVGRADALPRGPPPAGRPPARARRLLRCARRVPGVRRLRHAPLHGGGTANPVAAVAHQDRAPSPLGTSLFTEVVRRTRSMPWRVRIGRLRHSDVTVPARPTAPPLSLSRRGVRARRRLEEEALRPRPPPLVRYITSHYIELRYITLHRTVRRRRRFVVVAVGSSLARHRVCVPLSPPTPHPSVRAPPRLSARRNLFPPSTTRQRGVERDFVAAAEPPHARTPSPARVQSPPPPCWRDPSAARCGACGAEVATAEQARYVPVSTRLSRGQRRRRGGQQPMSKRA